MVTTLITRVVRCVAGCRVCVVWWPRYNDSAYVLCGVNTDITPQHWFCSADREWTSFAQYYRQKKGIELAHVQQPMVVANQCNVGALANILPGTGTIIPGTTTTASFSSCLRTERSLTCRVHCVCASCRVAWRVYILWCVPCAPCL
jgi:hypothetical protein